MSKFQLEHCLRQLHQNTSRLLGRNLMVLQNSSEFIRSKNDQTRTSETGSVWPNKVLAYPMPRKFTFSCTDDSLPDVELYRGFLPAE